MAQEPLHIPLQLDENGNAFATAYMGEGSQKNVCIVTIPKIIPVLFVPGVMGTNLKCIDIFTGNETQVFNGNPASDEDIDAVAKATDFASESAESTETVDKKTAQVAWKAPDGTWEKIKAFGHGWCWTEQERQMMLNPDAAFVDWDAPVCFLPDKLQFPRQIGGAEDAEENPEQAKIRAEVQRRGWGSVYQESYGEFLCYLEEHLNDLPSPCSTQPEGTVLKKVWAQVAELGEPQQPSAQNAEPQASDPEKQKEQIKDRLKKAGHYKFMVYACGYNWLRDNTESGNGYSKRSIEYRQNEKGRKTDLHSRIQAALAECQEIDPTCEKVIILTHSLGGIVARAYAFNDIASAQKNVMGIYHNTMPATGAPAFYKRIRAGFGGEKGIKDHAVAVVLGYSAVKTAPVLLNAPGALELMPWLDYNNNQPWLGVCAKGAALALEKWKLKLKTKDLLKIEVDPAKRNPQAAGAWYELLPDAQHIKKFELLTKTESGEGKKVSLQNIPDDKAVYDPRLNPAKVWLPQYKGFSDLVRLQRTLELVTKFQVGLAQKYFTPCLISYGDDAEQTSWGCIAWEGNIPDGVTEQDLKAAKLVKDNYKGDVTIELGNGQQINLTLSKASQPGDGTVPVESGQAPAYFKEHGYTHQDAYTSDMSRLAALYAILQFIDQQSAGKQS